jgi:Flp pilus assembly protein TadD
MELEFRELPPVVDLQSFGNEYGQLLNHYQQLASAMLLLEQKAPGDFLAKVVRAADRWRSVSPDPLQACMLAGRVLRTAGAADLAWDYYTTPLGHKPNESAPWLNLAKALQADNSPMLADRALAQAFDAEPTNAQILWDRAANLVQAGRANEARALYQLLADGQWQDRFLWLQNEAKRKLAGR